MRSPRYRSGIGLGVFCAVACTPTGNTDGDANAPTSQADVLLPALRADLSCFTPGESWRAQTTRADLGTPQPVQVSTTPLGGDEGEVAAEVELAFWYDNTLAGDPDATGTTDNEGSLTLTLPTCQPLTVRAQRDPDTETTYKANLVVDPSLGEAQVTVVETLTSASIKAILNETIDETSSLVAGTVFDCAGEPIAGVRARVLDADGNVDEEARDYYFNDADLPARRENQPYTNVDGKWVVFNLPVGDVYIEIYGSRCEGSRCEEIVLGGTRLNSEGDSINIGNVYAGVAEGVYYPDGCLQEETP